MLENLMSSLFIPQTFKGDTYTYTVVAEAPHGVKFGAHLMIAPSGPLWVKNGVASLEPATFNSKKEFIEAMEGKKIAVRSVLLIRVVAIGPEATTVDAGKFYLRPDGGAGKYELMDQKLNGCKLIPLMYSVAPLPSGGKQIARALRSHQEQVLTDVSGLLTSTGATVIPKALSAIYDQLVELYDAEVDGEFGRLTIVNGLPAGGSLNF